LQQLIITQDNYCSVVLMILLNDSCLLSLQSSRILASYKCVIITIITVSRLCEITLIIVMVRRHKPCFSLNRHILMRCPDSRTAVTSNAYVHSDGITEIVQTFSQTAIHPASVLIRPLEKPLMGENANSVFFSVDYLGNTSAKMSRCRARCWPYTTCKISAEEHIIPSV